MGLETEICELRHELHDKETRMRELEENLAAKLNNSQKVNCNYIFIVQ